MKPEMANMSHCRFENTLKDLKNCYEHLEETKEELGEYEWKAKLKLIELCLEIVSEVYPELGESDDNPLNYEVYKED
jgi:hypothetical protein